MELINLIEEEIHRIYKAEVINMLNNDFKPNVLENGKSIFSLREVIENYKIYLRENELNLNKFSFNFVKIIENIKFNSDEIAFFTAICFLYKESINDPIKDVRTDSNNCKYYPNFQNKSSKRYNMNVAVVFEKLYNYWDRLGDLLWATYFQNDLDEKKVDFYQTIKLIDERYKEYHSLDSFKWLLNFRDTDYHNFNITRKKIVHYTSIHVEFNSRHIGTFENDEGKQQNIFSNKEEIEKIMLERSGYYETIKKEIDNTIEGFIQIHKLIDEITNIKKLKFKI